MVKSRLAVSFVALALLAGACGDDDDSTTATTAAAGGTETTAAAGGTDTTAASGGTDTTAGGAAPSGEGGSIEVTSLWGGGEAAAFEAALAQFTEDTGVNVTYTAQREGYATVLNNRLAQNDPPDVAIIPGIGFLRSFANDGVLTPLADLGIDDAFLESAYQPGLAEMGLKSGTVGDTAYALVAKLNSKSTVWYRPDEFTAGSYEVPASFEDWVTLADTIVADGKVPLALGAQDSWTLTDWFENIYIRQAGVEAYDTLFSADGDFTDPSVQTAIDTMLTMLTSDHIVGGTDGALATAFVDGIGMVFDPEPQALMYYEGGFVGGIAVTDTNPDLVYGETIGFFPFPTVDGEGENTITIGGDVMAAFTDEPGVAEFMQWMASADGGKAWAAGGTIISPFAGVEPADYPDERTQAEAEHVASATTARYDGADLLPAGMSDSLGAALQTAFGDPGSAGSAFEAFNDEVTQAWEDEAG